MEKIPVRFKRVAAAFDKVARARICKSSSSEHSPVYNDLSDLVNSFMEKDMHYYKDDDKSKKLFGDDIEMSGVDDDDDDDDDDDYDQETTNDDNLSKALQKLIDNIDDDDDDDVKMNLRDVVEHVCKDVGDNSSSEGFKRVLMTQLRERGFDAGLCKSKWEKARSFPAGTYEYIDVNVSGTRYIVEMFLAGHFEIAKPTKRYISYKDMLPHIYVVKFEELKQLVRQMCTALRDSMRKVDMRVPPWRKNGYKQAKWSGAYKRTTNAVSLKISSSPSKGNTAKKQLVIGFDQVSTTFTSRPYYTGRGVYVGKPIGLKVGYLAAALNGNVNAIVVASDLSI